MDLSSRESVDTKIYIKGWGSKEIDLVKLKKMLFLFNALEEGWTVRKRDQSFIFTKKHEDKKEVFTDQYLVSFMKNNFDLDKLLAR